MKIRLSHVSNSSSSSYFLTIKNINFSDFVKDIIGEYRWDIIFSKKRIAKNIKDNIKRVEEVIKENKKRKDLLNSRKILMDENRKGLNQYKNFEKRLKECKNNHDLVKLVFDIEEIKLKIDSKKKNIELDYFSSMHNSYDESLEGLFKEMVLFCVFNDKYDTLFRREKY